MEIHTSLSPALLIGLILIRVVIANDSYPLIN